MRMLSVCSKLRLLLMPGCPPNSALKILLHVKVTIDVEHLTRDVVAIHNQVADGTSYFLGMPTGFVLIVLDAHTNVNIKAE